MKRLLPVFPIVFLSGLCLCHTSCRKTSLSSGPDSAKAIVLPAGGPGVMDAENQFAIDIFKAVLSQDTVSHNIMISPFSLFMALGMTDNGAAGATLDSINVALRLGVSSLNDLNGTATALISQMPNADPEVTMAIANSIWYNQGLTPLPAFQQTVQSSYNAKIEGLNFPDPSSLTTVNQWVATQTRQMIKNLLSSLTGPIVLVNAIYFKGDWSYGFTPDSTRDFPFVPGNGITESAPLMYLDGKALIPYYSNDSLTIINLPYGGKGFSMLALMPGTQTNIRSLSAALNPGSLAAWESKMGSGNIPFRFPKFGFDYGILNMYAELKMMGMNLAFQPTADFTRMYSKSTSLSQVVHKTAIQVDETGATAAAATGITTISATLGPTPPVYFDHPFLFVIQEKTSGAILFIGVLNDPLDTGS
jgi:serpin B